jgi:hypothetical protein
MAKPGPARIEALYRYPVKGLTPEPLESVELATAVIPAQAGTLTSFNIKAAVRCLGADLCRHDV